MVFTILPVLLLSALIAFQISPWPSVLLIRRAFNQDAQSVSLALEKHVPPALSAQLNEPYDPADPDALLDVFYPSAITDKPLPTIVWVHGGAWVSGSKDDIANYGKVLAGKGYTVVGVDYSLAPGKTFPTPIRQVNAALGYLVKNAERLRIDPDHIVLAGDSGGAHIAAVTANAIAVPSYAAMLGIVPAVERRQLAALLLFCGTYTIDGVDLDGPFGGFLRTVLWSFSGSKDFKDNPRFAAAWVDNPGSNWHDYKWYVNSTVSYITDRINDFDGRIIDIDYVSPGRYDVVLIKNTGVDAKGWWWYVGQTPAQIGQLLEDNHARLVDLEPDGPGTFAAVMVPSQVGARVS